MNKVASTATALVLAAAATASLAGTAEASNFKAVEPTGLTSTRWHNGWDSAHSLIASPDKLAGHNSVVYPGGTAREGTRYVYVGVGWKAYYLGYADRWGNQQWYSYGPGWHGPLYTAKTYHVKAG